VLEVLEDVAVNDKLVDALTVLVNAGYTLALDDFVYDPKWDRLLKIASIVKIDVLASSNEEIRSMVERRKSFNVKLLAEKVETQEQFDEMFALGFELFQGYFFTKPKVISHASVPVNHISLLQLLANLQDKDASLREIVGLVSQDVSLSYKLLRYLNSAHFALPQKVDSIQRAVVYFGLDLLRRWACLLGMANVDGKSSELLQTALVRARMCELIAERNAEIDADSFFTVGLFSTLDALLDMPIQDVLAELPLTAEVKDALTNFKGIRGEALRCVEACEQCDWSQMAVADIELNEIDNLYLESINWTSEVGGSISST
jgi:EAL and modified HD-GYP domain-containing signal transduction protein